MSQIRRVACIGDIIVGMAGSDKRKGLGHIYRQIIYWMQVEEDPTFDGYWSDSRFEPKRPQIPGPKFKEVGDRTYRHDPLTGEWKFEVSMHFIPDAPQENGGHVNMDTRVDRVLLGRRYTYWGKNGPKLPEHFITLFPPRRGYRRNRPHTERIDEFHQFLGLDKPCGLVGEPADWDNPKYFPRG